MASLPSPSSPDSQAGNVGPGEGENTKLYDESRAPAHDSVLEQQEDKSSESVGWRQSRWDANVSQLFSTPIDLQPFDLSELQRSQPHNQAYDYLGGAGKSDTNLQSTPGDSRESSVCGFAFGGLRVL